MVDYTPPSVPAWLKDTSAIEYLAAGATSEFVAHFWPPEAAMERDLIPAGGREGRVFP